MSTALAGCALVLVGCGNTAKPPAASSAGIAVGDPGKPVVYVAIGASDTVGVGSDNPLAETWPQILYVQALPRAATFFNLAVPGALTADAVRTQLPHSLSLKPSLVTVLLGVNDLIKGTDPTAFENDLEHLIAPLRDRAHAQVLIANLPVLDSVPAIATCISSGDQSNCAAGPGASRPRTVAALHDLSARYDDAIKRVASHHQAFLVDLAALGDYVGANPQAVSSDGFHPSDEGYRVIAREFIINLKRKGGV